MTFFNCASTLFLSAPPPLSPNVDHYDDDDDDDDDE
jgi:hypothetical protein